MPRSHRWMAVPAILAAVSLSACAKTVEVAAAKNEPFKVEKIEGTELSRLTLEAKAAERVGIKTERVAVFVGSDGGSLRTAVPYGAVLYDANGATFVYASPKPLVFLRHPVTVDHIEGELAILSEGPPRGTPVVTAGGAELTGIEFGVGK